MRIAVVFPGQGSHRAGSLDPWSDHPAFALVEELSAGAGRDLVALSRDESAGSRTADAQPAIMAASIVAWSAVSSVGLQPHYFAGHSLGEYSAAIAANCVSVEDGARLVAARGDAMGAACKSNPGTMAAVVKIDPSAVDQLVAEIHGLVVANDNAPGQVVLAGPPEAVEQVRAAARDAGGRAIPLDVEGAFHSPAMAPAVDIVRTVMGRVQFTDPESPVVSGTSARVLTEAAEVAKALVEGILSPVRWRDVQNTFGQLGVTDVIEVGPGGVLAGLARRSLPDVTVHTVQTPDDLAAIEQLVYANQPDSEVAK